ncbi:MAG: carboxypeptidase-like regulatory domain-containing protein [Verrucomicrobiales bacterium]|nr:carboxypeptidase-like regulatory domain-containing protein [Verrucomicrobiales bacterium]
MEEPASSIAQSSAPESIPVPRVSAETSNRLYQEFLAEWQAPIDFYGKVVDENGKPVPGARIAFQWTETPPMWGEAFEERVGTATMESDAQGLFSLLGKRGGSLTVWVNKDGYYASRGGKQIFLYSFPNSNGKFIPDPGNPVIFKLHTKSRGAFLIQKEFPPGIGQIWQLRADGTPIKLDLVNGSSSVTGDGQIKLEFWRDLSDRKARVFDWKLQLSVPGGGLLKTDEEFAFEAPLEGYQSCFVIEMPATNQAWRDNITSRFYVRLPDGKFGRIDLYLLAYNGVFTVHSAINPTGSRNLEPKE